MTIRAAIYFLSAFTVSRQPADEQKRRESAERVMEARFHLQEVFDKDLSARVPVSELDLPSEAAGRFDENGDGFVTFEEIERLESQAAEPQAPRDRSEFTYLREEGFPLNVDPEIVPASEAPIEDDDMVLGVVINGEPRAYPVNYMNGPYNEVVNDELGGEAIAPSW
jgi:hypothetical protein